MSGPALKKWFVSAVPNYAQTLSSLQDGAEFDNEEAIHKVYLFSNKASVPPIYKALTG